jgi:hypothetical protein
LWDSITKQRFVASLHVSHLHSVDTSTLPVRLSLSVVHDICSEFWCLPLRNGATNPPCLQRPLGDVHV